MNRYNETKWLNRQTTCDCCGDSYPIGQLIPTNDGDNVCEECTEIIEAVVDHDTNE